MLQNSQRSEFNFLSGMVQNEQYLNNCIWIQSLTTLPQDILTITYSSISAQ